MKTWMTYKLENCHSMSHYWILITNKNNEIVWWQNNEKTYFFFCYNHIIDMINIFSWKCLNVKKLNFKQIRTY